jgi:membrane glycosyltransferase
MWEAQNREDRSVTAREAIHGLWPQMLFGVVGVGALGFADPVAILWAAPTLLPCLLSGVFACATAGRRFGRLLVSRRLCAIPDEIEAPAELQHARRLETAPSPLAA